MYMDINIGKDQVTSETGLQTPHRCNLSHTKTLSDTVCVCDAALSTARLQMNQL